MALLPRNFNLVLCLLFLSLFFSHLSQTLLAFLSHYTPHPHPPLALQDSASVPGCWHNTDGPGSSRDVNLKERCLLWDFHCTEEALLLFLFTSFYHRLLDFFFLKLQKLLLPANFDFAYRFLSVLSTAHTFPC